MDSIFHPDLKEEWISKNTIHIQGYFDKYKDLVAQHHRPKFPFRGDLRQLPESKLDAFAFGVTEQMLENEAALEEETGLDFDTLNEIKDIADIDQLTLDEELSPMVNNLEQVDPSATACDKFTKVPIPESGIDTLQTLQQQDEIQRSDRTVRQKHNRIKLCRNINNNWFDSMPLPNSAGATTQTPSKLLEKESLLVARVYRPTKPSVRHTSSSSNSNMLRYHQEIHLLGSNLLTELRDFIKCPADETEPGDKSRDPHKKRKKAKEIYPSGFFYFEGVFYNDTRYPGCIDYSEVIREWASNPKRGVGPFRTAIMEKTRFCDLHIRLGYPYVFVHQGFHEHIIAFSEARLVNVEDSQREGRYPLERALGMKHSKFCMICCVSIATWVTKDNERLPEDPYFFCNDCFFAFNYSAEGCKIGSFTAHSFVDFNAL